jgi:hypothetical protein
MNVFTDRFDEGRVIAGDLSIIHCPAVQNGGFYATTQIVSIDEVVP